MLKQSCKWTIFLIFIFMIGLILPAANPAQAQDAPLVAVLPAQAEIDLDGVDTVVVDIYVSDAVDLNAFDITITYDSGILTLDSWQHGGMLNIGWEPAVVNQPGVLRVAAVQLGQDPVSGEGSLLKLTFSGAGLGTSPVAITEAVLARPDGEKTFPQLEHGEVTVNPPRHSLSGTLTLQGQNGAEGVLVTLGVGQTHGFGPYQAVSLPGGGLNLDFGLVVADTYHVTTHQPRYLNIHEAMAVFITVDVDRVLPDLHLKGGNAYGADNMIDISDASIVGTQYLMRVEDLEPGQVLLGDVNFDGIVNIQDLTMVAANFDLTSEAAYQDWLP